MVRPEFRDAILASDLWGRLRHPGRPAAEGSAGRGTASIIELAGVRCFVRHSWRGGLLDHLWRDLSLGCGRFFDELAVVRAAQQRDIPTADIVALTTERVGGVWFRADTYVREIPGAEDLRVALRRGESGGGNETAARLAAVGRAMRWADDVGLIHPDLNAGNILIRGEEVFFIDLVGARFVTEITDAQRRRHLFRLLRSLAKVGLAPETVRPADERRLIQAYCDRVPPLEWDADAFLEEKDRHVARHRRFWRS